jgi:hypothetical protein
MDLIELQLSMKTIDLLQKSNIWEISDIIRELKRNPSETTLVLAKIRLDDFSVITGAIKKQTKNLDT